MIVGWVAALWPSDEGSVIVVLLNSQCSKGQIFYFHLGLETIIMTNYHAFGARTSQQATKFVTFVGRASCLMACVKFRGGIRCPTDISVPLTALHLFLAFTKFGPASHIQFSNSRSYMLHNFRLNKFCLIPVGYSIGFILIVVVYVTALGLVWHEKFFRTIFRLAIRPSCEEIRFQHPSRKAYMLQLRFSSCASCSIPSSYSLLRLIWKHMGRETRAVCFPAWCCVCNQRGTEPDISAWLAGF